MIKINKIKFKVKLYYVCFFLLPILAFSQYLPENGIYHNLKTNDGVSLYVLEIGNNKAENTYIVLHGGFGAEHSYLINPLLPHSNRNRFILFDQRGSLRSPAADSLITFRNFVNDIEQIRKEFKILKINILAHSNGATIALDYLHYHPENVNKLIMIGCPLSIIDSAYFKNIDEPINKYMAALEVWQKRVSKNIEHKKILHNIKDEDKLTGIQFTLLQKILYAANHTYLMNEIEKTENAFFNPNVFNALQSNVGSEEWSKRTSRMSEALTKSAIPIFLINGEYDFVDPYGNAWSPISEQVPFLDFMMIKNAGHNIWLDKPKEFKKILKKVLN
ncbi:alpha/beta fold hydrolase [Cellulophaga sp. Hel_I_12]|uniref:alpha/beta fold hydrolase n=1 Tax=Cellulophaga sp. Hel_I_12 TaxID=1249972 RepID=UPI000645D5F6|nr:alpha/beta hydrolase [Cellulophaga sp. Hel_I_12]